MHLNLFHGSRYQKRIFGPLMDRIDIHMEVPRVGYRKTRDTRLGESSVEIRKRVEAARYGSGNDLKAPG